MMSAEDIKAQIKNFRAKYRWQLKNPDEFDNNEHSSRDMNYSNEKAKKINSTENIQELTRSQNLLLRSKTKVTKRNSMAF